jgi:hypothetical protein
MAESQVRIDLTTFELKGPAKNVHGIFRPKRKARFRVGDEESVRAVQAAGHASSSNAGF